MATKDSFFIRADVETSTTTYANTPIDLGSYVNLGTKSAQLLRIHNVAISVRDDDDPASAAPFLAAANTEVQLAMQLTTQQQEDMVHASDKSVISSGSIFIGNDTSTALNASEITQALDVLPQMWKNGYLVGVDTLYWAARPSTALNGEVKCSIVMECTIEAATQANSISLSLSQS